MWPSYFVLFFGKRGTNTVFWHLPLKHTYCNNYFTHNFGYCGDHFWPISGPILDKKYVRENVDLIPKKNTTNTIFLCKYVWMFVCSSIKYDILVFIEFITFYFVLTLHTCYTEGMNFEYDISSNWWSSCAAGQPNMYLLSTWEMTGGIMFGLPCYEFYL